MTKEVEDIKTTLKTIAILEAIICLDWEYRHYSYNSKWADGQEMASMRNGSGDEWFLWIKGNIMALKYLDHELGIVNDSQSITKQFPSAFSSFISEPAFSIHEASCLWYFENDKWVKFGLTNKSINEALQVFKWTSQDYKKWADEYYEKENNLNAISSIFDHKMNEKIVSLLNTEVSIKSLKKDIEEIGFQYSP